LSKLDAWSKQWLVNFNPAKTKYIVFSKKVQLVQYPDLIIGGEKLQRVKQHKQLGIIFTERMTFEAHIQENCKKAMNRLTALQRLGNKIPRKSRLLIYTAFVRPVLEFGFQLYDNSPKEQLEKLEKVQRKALLFVTGAYKKTSHRELLQEVGLPLLEKRRQSQKIQFIYKANNNLLPEYLKNAIPQMAGEQNNYNLRNPDIIPIPKSKKNYFLKSYIPSAIKVWNDTRIDVRRALSLQSLKASSYHLYLAEYGNGAVNHSRIRMGLSGLNAHRKKYNFILNSVCPFCNYRREDAKHFLLICPTFAAPRQQMLDDLARDIPDTVHIYINYPNQNNLAQGFQKLLISGTKNINIDKMLFKHVQKFISATNRFR